MRYSDGWSLWRWHGVEVPQEWIEDKTSLQPATALRQDNVERRRAACEIVGWRRILSELNVKVIDRDIDSEIGELVEVNLPDAPRERFLRVRCGTGRDFAIPVPPDMDTALNANSWTYGIDPDLLKQKEIRT